MCPCICNSGDCPKGCVCSEFITEYQEMTFLTESESEDDLPELNKVDIPYPDDLLEDAVCNLSIIRPDDYDNEQETVADFCSAKIQTPHTKPPSLTLSP